MLIVGESSFSGATIGTNNGRVMYMCTVSMHLSLNFKQAFLAHS